MLYSIYRENKQKSFVTHAEPLLNVPVLWYTKHMWKLSIATYKIGENGTHKEVFRSAEETFPTRFEAEMYMSDAVIANTDKTLKFLGFLDSPWGDHYSLDPTLVFWADFHLFQL